MAVSEPHPDTAARLLNVKSILERGPLASRIKWHTGRHATRAELERFHAPVYVDSVFAAAARAPQP